MSSHIFFIFASMDDDGSGGKDDSGSGSGKDDDDNDDDDHAGASVVGSIHGVDHGRTFGGHCEEIMNNFYVFSLWSCQYPIS